MDSRQRILITDGETRSVLAIARGLHGGGFEVAAAAARSAKPAPAHWSRAVSERILVPHPLEDERCFVKTLEDAVRSRRYEALIPGSDASLAAISRARGAFEPHTRLGLPEDEIVQRSLDKVVVARAADRTGLPTPEAVLCASISEGLQAAKSLGFPVILKPESSIVPLDHGARHLGSVRIPDEQRLVEVAPGYGRRFLIQKVEHGHVLSFAGIYAEGQLLGEVVSRYLRTWYPDAGNAAFSQTLEAPSELRERVMRLLEGLRWQGMFELELIERTDGGWSAIDFNPRPYGSLSLALGAGVNLPAIWCEHLLGRAPVPARARPGVFYRWEDADLRHALWLVRRGKMWAGMRSMQIHRGVTHPYFELRDPGPFVARALFLVKSARRRRDERAPMPVQQQDVRDPSVPTSSHTAV